MNTRTPPTGTAPTDSAVSQALRQLMSDGADGQADAAACSAAFGAEVQAREAWHVYHLIGDTLRSQDLASTAAHDAQFLAALRQRLQDEPRILAPQPLHVPAALLPAAPVASSALAVDATATGASGFAAAAQAGRSSGQGARRWFAPAAVAASFCAVAAALVVTRGDLGGSVIDATPVAAVASPQRQSASPALALAPAGPEATEPTLQLANGTLIRDARLDSYLRAHRGGTATLPLGASGRFETVALER